MELHIRSFLGTELTLIPQLLNKFYGGFYNNALCNGATWMFIIWCLVHSLFDQLLNALLRRMKYPHYQRIRLQHSLWYLGFYTVAFLYSCLTIFYNDIRFVTVNSNPFDTSEFRQEQLLMGFVVVLTFYLHSAFWEKLKHGDGVLASRYFCLFLLLCFSYLFRFLESSVRVLILIASTQVASELTRIAAVMSKHTEAEKFLRIYFVVTITLFILNYLIVMPIFLGYPLMKRISLPSSILLVCLLTWIGLEIHASVILRAIHHCKWHTREAKKNCGKDMYECTLFSLRTDPTYIFITYQNEMKKREEKCNSLRKPKTRNVVFQTLKCMVAIKRKLHEKHNSNKETTKVDSPHEEIIQEFDSINTVASDEIDENYEEENNEKPKME